MFDLASLKSALFAICTALALLCVPALALADASLSLSTTISGRAHLTLGSSTINFPSADPGVIPAVAASENPLPVVARIRTATGSLATLQVTALGDLINGSNRIAIDNVSWTASGSGFAAGTLSKTEARQAGSWIGSGARSGSFSFYLANSWDYPVGSYQATVNYTVSAP